ncbi:DOPA-like domain-containing protein [Hysterangium stoloniferum]|nr:DOPA-like domain-containing protein [Hysterangium stoloniferum]
MYDTGYQTSTTNPPTDLKTVVDSEIKEWHFHIYFLQNNHTQAAEALALRDAVLRLRRDGAFVAVPLYRVNMSPKGPHPAGSYEIWCPSESFASVFSYLSLNHGSLSVLVHPLTEKERMDHDTRKAWIGQPWLVDLDTLNPNLSGVPLQYASLKQGYSSDIPQISLAERRKRGAEIEEILKDENDAAKAPIP